MIKTVSVCAKFRKQSSSINNTLYLLTWAAFFFLSHFRPILHDLFFQQSDVEKNSLKAGIRIDSLK